MSVQAMSWVLDHSEAANGDRHVLISLANHAGRDEWIAWPSVQTIARESRLSERAAQYALRRLEAAGRLAREGMSRSGTVVYRIIVGTKADADELAAREAKTKGRGADHAPGAKRDEGGARRDVEMSQVAPEPSEPSVEPSISVARTDASSSGVRPVLYRGRRVPDETVADAERLLTVFCDLTGRSLGARAADGKASSSLTQIIGAMMARPEVTADHWCAGIRSVVAAPPEWMSGSWKVGFIFGEKASDWTLAAADGGAVVQHQRSGGGGGAGAGAGQVDATVRALRGLRNPVSS